MTRDVTAKLSRLDRAEPAGAGALSHDPRELMSLAGKLS
jgi:hypothetical protein